MSLLTRRKKKSSEAPAPSTSWHDRASHSYHHHPISWSTTVGTLASLVTCLGVLGAFLLWVDSRYEPRDDSTDRPHVTLRQEMLLDFAELKNKEVVALKAQVKELQERLRWSRMNSKRVEVVILRNRLNDCNEKRVARGLRKQEETSCDQYRQEYEEAKGVYERMQESAAQSGSTKRADD